MKRYRSRFIVASLLLVQLILTGCFSSAPVVTNSVFPAHSHNSSLVSTISAVSTNNPEPSATPARRPPPAAQATARTGTSKFMCNFYTASDGEYVYYFSSDAIHRMDISGGNDQKTKIEPYIYRFIYLDANNLFYLANENGYSPECKNNHGQTFRSFSLCIYDRKTQKIHTISKHLYDAVEARNVIYMLGHVDHSRVLSYDIRSGKILQLSSGAGKDNQYSSYLQVVDGKAYLDGCYLLSDNSIETAPIKFPDATVGIDNYGLENIFQQFDFDNQHYVLTVTYGNTDENGYEKDVVTLYVTSDEGLHEVWKKSCSYDGSEESMHFEMIDDWLFCFTIMGFESNQVSELLFKQRIS